MNELIAYDGPDWLHAALAVMCIISTLIILYQEHLLKRYDGAILFWPEDDILFEEDNDETES